MVFFRSKIVCAGDTHIYIKNSKQCTKQLLELIREFNSIAEYKDNIHESIFNIQYFIYWQKTNGKFKNSIWNSV